MKFWGRYTSFVLSALVAVMLVSQGCANRVSPTGGPRDTSPPNLVKTNPENKTLYFDGSSVTLYFDEFIKPATFGKEIFISPVFSQKPRVMLSSKKLKIKFGEELRDSTTYVISISGILDYYGNNKMSGSSTLAFSTGGVLDSMKVSGSVQNKIVGIGEKDVTILLFHPDSIEGNDFLMKAPAYVGKSSESGTFELPYLRNQSYKIYGVIDVDQSNSYNLPTEVIAIAEDPMIVFSDTSVETKTRLYAFTADNDPPRLKKYDWLNDSTLMLAFTENIRPDSLQLMSYDSLKQDSVWITRYNYIEGAEPRLILDFPTKRASEGFINLLYFQDSLENRADTLVRLKSRRLSDAPEAPYVKKPLMRFETGMLEFFLSFILPNNDSSWISLVDTGEHIVPATIESDFFRASIRPKDSLDPKLTYNILFNGKLIGEADTTFKHAFKWPDKADYGSIQGKLVMDTYEGPVVLILKNARGGEPLVSYSREFDFPLIKAGKYEVRVILDADSNQCWTPGSLDPYRLPELINVQKDGLSIRAGWTMEEHEIVMSRDGTLSTAPKEGEGQSGSGPPPDGSSRPGRAGKGR